MDLSAESESMRRMYGIDNEVTKKFGTQCLIARRLVESGVRFVHLIRNDWDHHGGLREKLAKSCLETDQPVAALLKDLKQRGLLDHTLVIWAGEFGRLPIAQLPADKDERKAGRDHNKNAFCSWLAGAGVKAGCTYGATDELGLAAVDNRVSVPDWHATILHLIGLHHDELFIDQNGLKEKLTGVAEANVVRGILA